MIFKRECRARARAYRFTPEFSINAIVSLTGLAELVEFSNVARISLLLEVDGYEKDRRVVFLEEDEDFLTLDVTRNNYFTDPPQAIVALDQLESVSITVACELYAAAKNSAHVVIDLGPENQNLYYSAPSLRVDREYQSYDLYEKPFEEEWGPWDAREIEPRRGNPFDNFRFGQ